MKLGVVGIGQAGGKIVDALLEYDQRTNSHIVRNAVAVNTATADLNALEYVSAEAQVLIGQSPGLTVNVSRLVATVFWQITERNPAPTGNIKPPNHCT